MKISTKRKGKNTTVTLEHEIKIVIDENIKKAINGEYTKEQSIIRINPNRIVMVKQ